MENTMNNEQEIIMEFNQEQFPLISKETPFTKDLFDGFNKGNFSATNKGIWNLICSKRDINLYVKVNMKPHRFWKITDVKKYFGIKGSGDTLLGSFMDLWSEYEVYMKEVKKALKQLDNE